MGDRLGIRDAVGVKLFYFYFLSPMAEQAAMRDVLRYVKGRVNGRDRWADGRAGGYAGGK